MKIIDAVWEKINLGVTCYEVIFEHDDEINYVEKNWNKFLERQYLVLKVPTHCPKIAAYVQSKGARYIESALNTQCDLRGWQVPESLKEICALTSYAPMDSNDVEVMVDEIRKGIFKTDRVYLDPYFTHEQAAQRYVNWSLDLLKRGEIPYKIMYRGETIGFFSSALSGVYSKFTGAGMGLFIHYSIIKNAQRIGQITDAAIISSNNPEVLNIRIKLGYYIKDTKYIFIKHND